GRHLRRGGGTRRGGDRPQHRGLAHRLRAERHRTRHPARGRGRTGRGLLHVLDPQGSGDEGHRAWPAHPPALTDPGEGHRARPPARLGRSRVVPRVDPHGRPRSRLRLPGRRGRHHHRRDRRHRALVDPTVPGTRTIGAADRRAGGCSRKGASVTGPSPLRLLSDYRRGDFFLATAERTLLGTGALATVCDADESVLAERVRDALDDVSTDGPPLAVGVLPFHSTAATPGRLVVPTRTRFGRAVHPEAAALPRRTIDAPVAVRPVPDPVDHMDAVTAAVTALAERGLRKVVLARALDIEFDAPVRPEAILHNLVKDHDRGYTFAAELPAGKTLVGSSPELLLSRRGRHVVSYPHAGSMPRSTDPEIDERNARTLLASRKDHLEHAVLTEAVVQTLRPYCTRLHVPPRPEL